VGAMAFGPIRTFAHAIQNIREIAPKEFTMSKHASIFKDITKPLARIKSAGDRRRKKPAKQDHKVSIVMAIYNTEKYIGEALESVLSQNHKNFELIAVDDCSTDGSARIIDAAKTKDSRIRVIRLDKNQGRMRAFAIGIGNCRGSYITALDSDDMFDTKRISEQLEFMQHHNLDFSCCDVRVFFEDGTHEVIKCLDYKKNLRKKLVRRSKEHFDMELLPGFHLGYAKHKRTVFKGGFMFRREILDACYFDDRLPGMEDHDFWFQVICKGYRIARFPKPYYFYRQHDAQCIKDLEHLKKAARAINTKLIEGAYFN
jgi:glycosyltransferase involved in cell wall biosynthesis